jgi:glycosyltransferase involved in cell wall biosynthesis
MKILQIIYESFGNPFGFGGAGVRAYEIYKRIKDRHDVTLLCMRYPGARDGEIQGLKHVFVGVETKNLTKSVLAYTIKAGRFVRKYGKQFDVIVENFLPSTPFFSGVLTETPVILQVQGIMENHSFRKFALGFSLPMFLCERFYPVFFKRFIFVSNITKKKVMARVRGPVTVCNVIPNGISNELLRSVPGEGDYILFFSRIDTYTKGIDILTAAFERLSPNFPDLRLILAGYEFDRVADLLSRLPSPVKNKIEYAGFLTGGKKIDLLRRAKIVVLPSRHESAPISILEAAACGKPVIVSDIPELKFVEENRFGMSFPSGSVQGLKEKVELFLRNDALRDDMGKRGREFARNFLWDDISADFEETLLSVLHEKEK